MDAEEARYKIVIPVFDDKPSIVINDGAADAGRDSFSVTKETGPEATTSKEKIHKERNKNIKGRTSRGNRHKPTRADNRGGNKEKPTRASSRTSSHAGKEPTRADSLEAGKENSAYLQLPLSNKRRSQLSEETSLSSGSGSTAGSTTNIINRDIKYENNITQVLKQHRRKKLCYLLILLAFMALVIFAMIIVALFLTDIL